MAGTLIVSLDFELFWGMLDVCPLEKYQDHVLGGRKAIPELLALFQKYGIHATWATVGYLFAGSAQEAASFFPEEALRPTYDDPALNSYAEFSKIGETDAPSFLPRPWWIWSPKRRDRRLAATPFPITTARKRGRRRRNSRRI